MLDLQKNMVNMMGKLLYYVPIRKCKGPELLLVAEISFTKSNKCLGTFCLQMANSLQKLGPPKHVLNKTCVESA